MAENDSGSIFKKIAITIMVFTILYFHIQLNILDAFLVNSTHIFSIFTACDKCLTF